MTGKKKKKKYLKATFLSSIGWDTAGIIFPLLAIVALEWTFFKPSMAFCSCYKIPLSPGTSCDSLVHAVPSKMTFCFLWRALLLMTICIIRPKLDNVLCYTYFSSTDRKGTYYNFIVCFHLRAKLTFLFSWRENCYEVQMLYWSLRFDPCSSGKKSLFASSLVHLFFCVIGRLCNNHKQSEFALFCLFKS